MTLIHPHGTVWVWHKIEHLALKVLISVIFSKLNLQSKNITYGHAYGTAVDCIVGLVLSIVNLQYVIKIFLV